jgi:C4-dicarboxylate-specific signal transduction histidine kinase
MSERNENNLQFDFDENLQTTSYMTTLQALSHLTNVTSKELDQINNTLHTKVVNEIEKNLEYEKKVFDSMKMASLGEMIANIAHQWRQPLSVITTSASAMQLNKDLGILDDQSFVKYTDMMIAQAMYLSDTINVFRDFIQEEHKLCNVVLQNEIENTIKILDVVLKDNGIKLIQNLNHEKPIVLRLVVGELMQVIINIINNAKDALNETKVQEDSKWIKLDLFSDDEKCMITIEDNGAGIPHHVLPNIFKQNFTTKKKSIGTGIGLYMSYNIVVKHFGGNLYAQNSESGAKFFIEIPFDSKSLK